MRPIPRPAPLPRAAAGRRYPPGSARLRQRFFEYATKVFRLGDAPAFHAEGGRHGGVIGDARSRPRSSAGRSPPLARLDPAVGRVRDHDKGERQLDAPRLELAHAHPKLPSPMTATVFTCGRAKCAPIAADSEYRARRARGWKKSGARCRAPGSMRRNTGTACPGSATTMASASSAWATSATTRSGLIGLSSDRARASNLANFSLLGRLHCRWPPRPLKCCQRLVQRRQRELRIADKRHIDIVVGAGTAGSTSIWMTWPCRAPDGASARWSPSRRGSRRRRSHPPDRQSPVFPACRRWSRRRRPPVDVAR